MLEKNRRQGTVLLRGACGFLLAVLFASATNAEVMYNRLISQLREGQSFGNINTYVTLDQKTDIIGTSAAFDSGVRNGFFESTNLRNYASEWSLSVVSSAGKTMFPVDTSFYPAHQQTRFRSDTDELKKTFFLPFEVGYSRAGHFILERDSGQSGTLHVHSKLVLPVGTIVQQASVKGWNYALIRYSGEGTAVLWGAASSSRFELKAGRGATELVTQYEWRAGKMFALSFAYLPGRDERAVDMLLRAIYALNGPDTPAAADYLAHVGNLLMASESAMRRYIDKARLLTPDSAINQANTWGKVNLLRVQEEYRWGEGESDFPSSAIVVGRNTMWYLMGSDYFAQAFSRELLEFWFKHGVEPNGESAEYLLASHDPILRGDYEMNINDDTPLMMLAASHYYSLTGDRAFLQQVYPSLLRSAEWIQSQRTVGENNHYGLLWCTSTELGTRGLFTWRNIGKINISGAVTEVNSEAYAALHAISELAAALGDTVNQARYEAASEDLRESINRYLRPQGEPQALYYLNIDPAGRIVKEDTVDQLFPVLFGVAEPETASAVLEGLFDDRYFVTGSDGAGGFRTVSSKAREYRVGSRDNYGLHGGIYSYPAAWIGRAAALRHRPDLTLKALRADALFTEVSNPGASGVVPGQFADGYFDDSTLQHSPWSGFSLCPVCAGSFVWSSLESFLGLSPHPMGIEVEPELPKDWEWAAASNIPYSGTSLTLLAVSSTKTLYTTTRLITKWNVVTVPAELQSSFKFEPEDETFGLVVPAAGGGLELIATSSIATEMRVINRVTKEEVMRFPISAGGLVRKRLPAPAFVQRARDAS